MSTIGASVQGSLGIGLAMVAGPALISIDAGFAPGPFLVAGQMISLRHVVAERHHIDRAIYRRCLYGLPFGLGAGLAILITVDEDTLAIIIGTITAVAALSLLAGAKIHRRPRTDVAAGAATSLASVTAGLPGPAMAIAFSDMEPATMRGTTSAFVMTQALIGFVAIVATDNFGTDELELTGWLIPGVMLGLFAARYVRNYVDRSWFRPAVLTMALVGGVALVIRHLI